MAESKNFLNSEFPKCGFPGCTRQGQKRSGLCLAHRNQQKRGQELKRLPYTSAEIQDLFGGKCQLDFCDDTHWNRGYCKYHYQQHARGREFTVKPERAARATPCTFPGCDRMQHSKGHCATHAKQRRDGKELTPLPIRAKTLKCSFETCDLEVRTKGLCAAHYGQSRRGDGKLSELRDYFTPGVECGVENCDKDADGRGLCKFHRDQSRKYNLSNEMLSNIFRENRCDICGSEPGDRSLHIDHDHKCCPMAGSCGKCVRGVLCSDCNLSLGKMGDSPERLERAARYLREGSLELS